MYRGLEEITWAEGWPDIPGVLSEEEEKLALFSGEHPLGG